MTMGNRLSHGPNRLKRLVLGYQRLTSMCLTIDDADIPPPDDPTRLTRLNCTAINHVHKRATKFQLDVPCDPDSNLDVDSRFRPVANLQYLPEFLQVGHVVGDLMFILVHWLIDDYLLVLC